MTFTPEQIAMLSAKLDGGIVKNRLQAGRKLDYLEGWQVEAEANRIFGFDAWCRETVYCHEVCRYERKSSGGNTNWKVGYEAKVRVTVLGTVREGTGHGAGEMGDLYDAIESAAKEAETDAMKRALKTFGNPFGLALYDKSKGNVEPAAPKTAAPQKSAPALAGPTAAPLPDVGPTTVITLVQAFESAKTIEAVDDIWKRNRPERDALKIHLPDGLREVIDAAAKRKKQLTPTKAA